MADRLKLSIVSPYPVFPAFSGGKVRIFQLARHLAAAGIEVTIFCPYKPGSAAAAPSDSPRVVELPYPFPLHHMITDRPLPYQYLISIHPGYRLLLERQLADSDVVQFEHVSFADLLDAVPASTAVVYDAHNVEYDYTVSECRNDLVRNLVGRRIYRLERRLTQRADAIVTCSAEDEERLSILYDTPSGRFRTIPNGIEETSAAVAPNALERLPGLARYPHRALFAGSNVEHNRRAVRFLIDELAPRLGEHAAIVVKGGCAYSLPANRPANVFADTDRGTVASIASACTVALHPVMQGSGTSLKLLDYLSHGLPVISTEFGMRGYPDLRDFVSIRKLDEFAAAMLAPRAASDGIAEVLRGYLWSKGAEDLVETYRSLL